METLNQALTQRIATELAPHRIVVGFDGHRNMWPAFCNHCGAVEQPADAKAMDDDDRLAATAQLHHALIIEPLLATHTQDVLRDAAEHMAGESEGAFYDLRKAELAKPYSKPMLSEQWAELDGIESASQWLKVRAGQ